MLLSLFMKRYFGYAPLIRYLPVGARSWIATRVCARNNRRAAR